MKKYQDQLDLKNYSFSKCRVVNGLLLLDGDVEKSSDEWYGSIS